MERNSKYTGNPSSWRIKREQPRGGGSSNTNYYGNAYDSSRSRRYDNSYENDRQRQGSDWEQAPQRYYAGRSWRNRRFNNNRNNHTHYGHERDERYSEALGYELGYLRDKEEEVYPTYSRYEEQTFERRHPADKTRRPTGFGEFDRNEQVYERWRRKRSDY